MANRTVKDAHSVKGTNPQYLVEKIIRTRIYESKYWKEHCFALSAELMVDKAMELRYVGGIYGGNVKPCPFLCLVLKMLQIQPDKDIIVEFISQQDFKYVRALGAVYMRLTGNSLDCYKYLEPLYLDYRKLRKMNKNGDFELIHMDEFIDELLREERVVDVILPRIQKRAALEEGNQLPAKENYLEDDMEDVESSEDDEDEGEIKDRGGRIPSPERGSGYRDWDKPKRSPSPRFKRSRSRSPHRRHRNEDRHRRDRDRKRSRSKERRRDRSRERRHRDDKESSSSSHKKHKSHKHDDDERRHHHKSKKSKKDKDDKRGGMSKEELEIQEANELRAKLGMAPLR